MAGLLIKDLPKQLHRLLKQRATLARRSMAREALVLLEEAVRDRAGPATLEEVDAWRTHGTKPLSDALLREARLGGRP